MVGDVVLVTGATGHIGNVLVRRLLEKGAKVRALVLPGEDMAALEDLAVEKVMGDVLDPSSLWESFEGAGYVFHLAGVISILPGENSRMRRVNVEGTVNVLNAALHSSVKRLVYTSSIHALARVPSGRVVDENIPYDCQNPYGAYDRSKAEATFEVQEAARAGLDAVIACPTGVIGPYDFRSSMMGNIIRAAAQCRPIFYVDGAYDFVDVRDVADGLIAIAEKGKAGESYILSGQQISVDALLETVHQITGQRFRRFKVPLSLAKFLAHFAPFYYRLSKTSPRFTPYSVEVLQSNSLISHAKATYELDYHPRPLCESVSDAIRWFFEHRRSVAA